MPSDQTGFSASYDRTTIIISTIVVVTLLVIAAAIHNILVGGIALLVVILGFAYSPRSYGISDRTITVKRLIGDVLVPLEGVREVRRVNADDLRGCIRLWGSGGLFGYYGLFTTTRFGRCTWYATNRKNFVVVITESKITLYSPDDVDSFMGTIRAFAPAVVGPVSEGSVFEPFVSGQQGSAGRVAKILVGTAIAGTSIAAVLFGFLYSPGVPNYTLTADALTIHDRFYPVTLKADSIDVNRIRVIDLAEDPEWRPTRRTNGFANTHYHSGWFRVENGKTVRLYQSGQSRLVLLPPKGPNAPVLVEAKEPEKLARDIRDQWAH